MFEVIEGGKEARPIVKCPRCGGATFMSVQHTLRRDGKRITQGVKAKACASCMANGELTLI